ncbi:MAG: hypothetical protein JXQ29_07570 [Planctomycetes bacterium]|nr:hypothetical protein [Planctomycetota bacterium]
MRTRWLVCGAILLAALAGVAYRFDRPWTAGMDQMGARYSIIARNFVRDGVLDPPLRQRTHLGQPRPGVHFTPVHTHPPLVPLVIAAAFRLTGTDAAWAARLAMLPAFLLALFLVYRLGASGGGRRRGVAAALVFAVAPGSGFYGAFPDPVSWWIIALVLLFVHALRPWTDARAGAPGWGRGAALALVFAAGMLAEWHMAFLVPLLLVLWGFGGRARRLAPLLPLLLAIPALLLAYRVLLPAPEEQGGYLFVLRKLARPEQWSLAYWQTVLRHQAELLGWPLLAATGLSLLALAFRIARRRATPLDRRVWILLAFLGLLLWIYPLAFRLHDYCHLYLLPPAALLVGDAMLRVHAWFARRAGRRVAAAALLLGLLAWAGSAVHHTLRRDRALDAYVMPIQLHARVLREAVRPDEIAAAPVGLESNESICYYADRMMIPMVTTPELLEALKGSAFAPAAYILAPSEASSYPALIAYLDAGWPRRDTPVARVYDLRPPRAARGGEAGPEAAVPDVPAVRGIRTRRLGSRVEIHWDPVPDPRVRRYRLYFGAAPRQYVVHVDAAAPPLVREAEVCGTAYFVVAPVLADGRIGTRSAEHSIELESERSVWRTLAALAAATLGILGLHLVVVLRTRPGSPPARRPPG